MIQPERYTRERGHEIQSPGAETDTPIYGTFTCEIVFWHIPAGEVDDFNDITEGQWGRVMRGQTLPMW